MQPSRGRFLIERLIGEIRRSPVVEFLDLKFLQDFPDVVSRFAVLGDCERFFETCLDILLRFFLSCLYLNESDLL